MAKRGKHKKGLKVMGAHLGKHSKGKHKGRKRGGKKR
jgi:hypothetical protein